MENSEFDTLEFNELVKNELEKCATYHEFVEAMKANGFEQMKFNNIHAVFYLDPNILLGSSFFLLQIKGYIDKEASDTKESIREILPLLKFDPSKTETEESFNNRIELMYREISIQDFVDEKRAVSPIAHLSLQECEKWMRTRGKVEEYTEEEQVIRAQVIQFTYECAKELILEHGYNYEDLAQ